MTRAFQRIVSQDWPRLSRTSLFKWYRHCDHLVNTHMIRTLPGRIRTSAAFLEKTKDSFKTIESASCQRYIYYFETVLPRISFLQGEENNSYQEQSCRMSWQDCGGRQEATLHTLATRQHMILLIIWKWLSLKVVEMACLCVSGGSEKKPWKYSSFASCLIAETN